MKQPRIAIVHDWLTNMGGAERVVLALHEAFPSAPIYTSVYEPGAVPLFGGLDIRTTWIQRFPRGLRKLHKWFPVIQVWAFRALDMSEYDIIISSSSLNAKQVRKTREGQIHICYCHTPVRYYWSHYDEYKKDPGFGKLNWLVKLLIPLFVPHQKRLDYQAAQEVDLFIANSSEVQKRIKKYYHRNSTIVHPPVDVDRLAEYALNKKRHGYVALGRQVPYKRIDLAVAACTKLDLPLTVFGTGSEHEKLVRMAGPSVTFTVGADDKTVAAGLGLAKGFIFPAEEDFGIVQVEALAAGTPVIAYKKGGTTDIVQDGETGIFFDEQTVDSLATALGRFETMSFLPATLHRRSKRFAKSLFINKIRKIVSDFS
ncbi:glycosyl transferase, group 1 [candidate division TM7 genomosp. GTL1]|nr:glycosyl transferase, group 1 [candidate division TM7 genomosp. GTL1]